MTEDIKDEFTPRNTLFIESVYWLTIIEIYLLWTICLDFSCYFSGSLFPPVLFVMHDTNDLTQLLTIGSISRQTRMQEGKKMHCVDKDRFCLSEHVLSNPTHTNAAGWSTDPPKAISWRSRKSIFLGVHSCFLALWGAAGGSWRRQKGKPG